MGLVDQPPFLVQSADNAKLKAARRVYAGKDRQHFLLEGRRLIDAALDSGSPKLRWLLFDPAAALTPGGSTLLARWEAAGLEAMSCDPKLLRSVCDVDAPQGFVAMSACFAQPLDTVLSAEGPIVVAAGLSNPANLGALLRVAAAAGAAGLVTTKGSSSLFHPRSVRASAGTLFALPSAQGVASVELIAAAELAGRELWAAATGGEDARGCSGAAYALLFGAEGAGVPDELLAACTRTVAVPLANGVESLNVATAAAAVLYRLPGGA